MVMLVPYDGRASAFSPLSLTEILKLLTQHLSFFLYRNRHLLILPCPHYRTFACLLILILNRNERTRTITEHASLQADFDGQLHA